MGLTDPASFPPYQSYFHRPSIQAQVHIFRRQPSHFGRSSHCKAAHGGRSRRTQCDGVLRGGALTIF